MSAAAWSRSRGVAVVRATTGLFSIFTLLCLVCLSSSLTCKDKLKEVKERNQKAQKQLDDAKKLSFHSTSRTAMSAAAWSRSRGVAGVRATTGLFSIFTLLCLVCLSSSLTHKDRLAELKEKRQKAQKQLDEVKAIYESKMDTAKHFAGLSLNLMESLEAFAKANEEAFPDDSLRLQEFVQGVEDLVERNKNKVEINDEEMRAQIVKNEKELESFRKLITVLEEQHAEL